MPTNRRKVVAWLAWMLCLLCVGLAVGALLLWLLNGRALIEFVREGDGAVATLVVSFSVVGALIVSHRPENIIGWIFCAAALCQGLSEFGLEYATYALITRRASSGSRDVLVGGLDLGTGTRSHSGVLAPLDPHLAREGYGGVEGRRDRG
jgi:hypothetical protein